MPENLIHQAEVQEPRLRTVETGQLHSGVDGLLALRPRSGAYSAALLRNPDLNGHCNGNARGALFQSAQRLHGNRAVQRFVHHTSPASSTLPVQRDGWDILKGWTVGDWQIKPPTWSGETDDRYDTPENQRRAEQKEADERGQSDTPPDWWKDPKPKTDRPWLPNIKYKKQPENPFIDIPPQPPEEWGDFPIPPWPDGEVPA